MKGVVIHCEGRVLRCLEGRHNAGLLSVQAVLPVPILQKGEGRVETVPPRPLTFAFYYGGKLYACARKVVLAKGRRYPGIEHWFVYPDWMPPVRAGRFTENRPSA